MLGPQLWDFCLFYLCVCVHACVQVYMYMHVKSKGQPWMPFLRSHLSFVLRQMVCWVLVLINEADQWAPGTPLSLDLQHWDYKCKLSHPDFDIHLKGSNSGSHACVTKTLMTELFSQLFPSSSFFMPRHQPKFGWEQVLDGMRNHFSQLGYSSALVAKHPPSILLDPPYFLERT